MSFGYGISDIIALGQLAWKVYKSCKDAPESFKNVSQEALSLHALLMEVGENLPAQTLSSTRQARLKTIGDGCRNVLEELQGLVGKYESLGAQSKRTWDRVKWGYNDIAELRSRLSSNALLLTAFISTTQVVVEKKLDKLLHDFQDGKYEGSVVTTQTEESLSTDEKETWRIIRKELEGIGITVAAFDANRDFIMDWFKTSIASRAFEEQTLEDSSSTMACGEDLGRLWEDSQYPTEGQSVTKLSPLTIQNTATQDSLTLEAQSTQEITQKAMSSYLPADELSTSAKAKNMQVTRRVPQKGRVTAATLRAWLLRYDKDLIDAAILGQTAVVRRLLEKGANVNAKRDRHTALQWAAWEGMEPVVRLLVENGAEVNAKSRRGTALVIAAMKGHEVVVRLLLENGAEVDTKSSRGTALVFAAMNGNMAVVRLLLENGADANATRYGDPALQLAACSGYEAVVRLLLENGAEVNAKSSRGTALVFAAMKGHEVVVRLLLENGADANAKGDGDPALHWEAWGGALHLAAWRGYEAVVRLLLKNGAEVNAKSSRGTALVLAAMNGNVAVVRLLLENGADANAKGDGNPALQSAAWMGYEAVVRLLLKNGAEVNAESSRGTALVIAAMKGHEVVVRLLLENGADFDAKGDGMTALQWATENGYEAVVQLLRTAARPPN